MAHRDADLTPRGAEHAAARVSLQRIRRRVHVREPSHAAIGQALGRRYHDGGYHAQGAARRQLLSMVWSVTRIGAFMRHRRKSMDAKFAMAVGIVGLAMSGWASSASAHHAFAAEFDANKPVTF